VRGPIDLTIFRATEALVSVDVQNDFCRGAREVPDGDAVVDVGRIPEAEECLGIEFTNLEELLRVRDVDAVQIAGLALGSARRSSTTAHRGDSASAPRGGRRLVLGTDRAGDRRHHGFVRKATCDEVDAAAFDRTLAINLRAPFLLARAVLPGMRERRYGRTPVRRARRLESTGGSDGCVAATNRSVGRPAGTTRRHVRRAPRCDTSGGDHGRGAAGMLGPIARRAEDAATPGRAP
jgi:hypothetical protein